MSHLLAFGLRFRPTRRLLARMRWPRPEHLARLTRSEFIAYIRAIGLEQESQAILARYMGDRDQSQAVAGVRGSEAGGERPAGAPVP